MNPIPGLDPLNPELSAPLLEPSATTEEVPSAEHAKFLSTVQDFTPPIDAIPAERPLFQSWYQPEILPPTRIPNFGHLLILAVLGIFGTIGAVLVSQAALHFHLFGISTVEKANTDIHYTLINMTVLYLIPFIASLLIFPLIWHKSLFAGLQWNAATAFHLRWRLFSAACVCLVLAMIDGLALPGPSSAPIDKLFQTPMEAWLLFAFGVAVAPFFEEIIFRGFLLPALCTAWDWTAEHITHTPPPPLGQNGQPQWSIPAMIVASILTSIPFALMHAEQIANSIGPLLLLYCVSLVLCWARLTTRSLAASVMVHSCYNFLLFSIMLYGTGGFQHLDKM